MAALVPVRRAAPGLVRAGAGGWIGLDEVLASAAVWDRLVHASGPRFRSDDTALVGAQVAREAIAAVVGAAVCTWARHRRVPVWTAGTVAVRAEAGGVAVGLRRLHLAVLADDELAGVPSPAARRPDDARSAGLGGRAAGGAHGGGGLGDGGGLGGGGGPSGGRPHAGGAPDVAVVGEAELLDRLVDGVLGSPGRRGPGRGAGRMPTGPDGTAASVPAVAALVAAARRSIGGGERHLWGTAAVTLVNALTEVSHDVGGRADDDRAALLARRPDLARTVELVSADDGTGRDDTVTCARRRTCCLLVQLPDAVQCGTCNRRDADECRAALVDRARRERSRVRLAVAPGPGPVPSPG